MNTFGNTISKVQHLKRSNALRLCFDATAEQSRTLELSAELLRTHSPSAEVRQHGQPILVAGKAKVVLNSVEPVGHYGVRLMFDDGHNTGIYTWAYLLKLGVEQSQLWEQYRSALQDAGLSRYPDRAVVQLQLPNQKPKSE